MTLLSDLRTGILLARRARYISTSLWLLLAILGLALMAAQFSGRQPATVALDVGLSAIKLFLPLLIILLAQELLSREFDRKYYLTSLTYPRPRHWLLLGRLSAILLLVYSAMLVMAIALAWVTSRIAMGYEQATPVNLGSTYWVTLAFIAIDLFVLTAFAGLLAITASTPSFVLIGTLGFMLISRSYSNIIALLERERFLLENTDVYRQSLGLLDYLLPDLAALDVRMISLYGKFGLLPTDWAASLAANLAYGLALIILAIFFLQRKRFS
ncbi:MAG: hypothetical protein ABFS08_00395 [Pseudomonadota bacterium]